MVCLVSSSTKQKIIWRQIGFLSLTSERARYYMTELQKFNKNITFTIEGAVIYDCMNKCTRNLMMYLVSSSTEQKIIWRQISVSDQNARAISMTQFQNFNTNIYLTIEGTWCIWLHAELYEESNGVFSFFIYRAENN